MRVDPRDVLDPEELAEYRRARGHKARARLAREQRDEALRQTKRNTGETAGEVEERKLDAQQQADRRNRA